MLRKCFWMVSSPKQILLISRQDNRLKFSTQYLFTKNRLNGGPETKPFFDLSLRGFDNLANS